MLKKINNLLLSKYIGIKLFLSKRDGCNKLTMIIKSEQTIPSNTIEQIKEDIFKETGILFDNIAE